MNQAGKILCVYFFLTFLALALWRCKQLCCETMLVFLLMSFLWDFQSRVVWHHRGRPIRGLYQFQTALRKVNLISGLRSVIRPTSMNKWQWIQQRNNQETQTSLTNAVGFFLDNHTMFFRFKKKKKHHCLSKAYKVSYIKCSSIAGCCAAKRCRSKIFFFELRFKPKTSKRLGKYANH